MGSAATAAAAAGPIWIMGGAMAAAAAAGLAPAAAAAPAGTAFCPAAAAPFCPVVQFRKSQMSMVSSCELEWHNYYKKAILSFST